MTQETYEKAATRMIDREYERAAAEWGWEHDLRHTEDEWQALILAYVMGDSPRRWQIVAGLAKRALVMHLARPIELGEPGGVRA